MTNYGKAEASDFSPHVCECGKVVQHNLLADLAASFEHNAREFYYEQYGDTPYDTEMVKFASRFAACQITGYRAGTKDNHSNPAPQNVPEREWKCPTDCNCKTEEEWKRKHGKYPGYSGGNWWRR